MREHFPALVAVIPMIAAPLCVVLRRLCPPWIIAFAASLASFVAAAGMLAEVWAGAVIEYTFGGWEAPVGIAFRVDALNAPIAVLLTVVATVVSAYAPTSIAKEVDEVRRPFFYVLMMLCLSGLAGMTVTQDLFNAFVFMEIAALSSYALVALSTTPGATLAALRYLVIGSVGTTFFLLGVGYLYMLTGTLNYADISARITDLGGSRTFLAAIAFIAAGLAMKIALFPLHSWLPAAYAKSPSAATGFLAAVGAKVSLYLLVRLYFDVLRPELKLSGVYLNGALVLASATAILYASWRAICARDVKRLLAFSSVAQIAYITLGVSLVAPGGFAAAWLQMFGHALTKGGLFLALGCVVWSTGSYRFEDLRGLGSSAPWTAAAIVVGGLGLIGVPMTAGFVAKWHLVLALAGSPQWWLLAVVLPGSLLAAVYVWRMVEVMYFAEAEREVNPPPTMVALSWVMVGATIFFGVHAEELTHMAESAAKVLS